MAREEINIKNIKKLNNSGKPKKSGGSWKNGKPKPAKKNADVKGKDGAFKKSKTVGKNKDLGKQKISEKIVKKTSEHVSKKVPEEWLYLSEESDALLRVKSVCADACGYDVEFWKELGVIEVIVNDHVSMDFEELEIVNAEDDNLEEYCKNHNIKMVAAVTVRSDDYKNVCNVMREIQSSAGGFFCQDNGRYMSI